MFGMGMPEILVILAIALIVLGPKKLPEIARSLGRGIAEFKKATQEFKENLEVDNELKEVKDTIHEIKGDIEQTVQEPIAEGTDVHDRDAVSEEDLEDSFDGDMMETPKERIGEKSPRQADAKESSSNA
ncbi:MAG: twin-arginine translocase subunit TatB [Deltaproteobacteria bacterium]|nr:twin-arginine translocase subunit TatB [Deltaproteobacteria bacterium]RLB92309.1 MAG: twin-arginine translocase subunit TatB [Deltaproteobacteria bacterium]RLC12402.1 MAG: twin-arginine translocase subunit TatB [Deltaproteobacteria bacterium]